MEAKLVTAIAAIIDALAWPVAFCTLLIVFKNELRNILIKIPIIMDRVETWTIGGVVAEVKQLADQVTSASGRSGEITPEQIRVSASVESQSRDIEEPALLKQMDRLSAEYDTIRRTTRGGASRTQEMTKVLVQMRGLARAVVNNIEKYKSSSSPGRRLAAIAMMQMETTKADLNWLRDRFFYDAPFIFYHASLALQLTASEGDPVLREEVMGVAREALAKVVSFAGGPDYSTVEVLRSVIGADREIPTEP